MCCLTWSSSSGSPAPPMRSGVWMPRTVPSAVESTVTTTPPATASVLGLEPERIDDILPALRQPKTPIAPPPLWDGLAAKRIATVLEQSGASASRYGGPVVKRATEVRD